MSLQTPVGHANVPADRWSSRAPFLVVAGVVVVSVVAIYLIGLSLLRTNDQIIQSQRRVEHAERLVWSLIDAEAGQRGYLLTGDEAYLEPYLSARERITSELQAANEAKQFAPDDRISLEALVASRLSEIDQTVELRRQHDVDAAMAVVHGGTGKQIMDRLRALVGRAVETERNRQQELMLRRDQLANIRTVVFAVAGSVILAFLGWAYRRIAREMARRHDAANEVARQRELLDVTLRNIGDGVIVTDAHATITFLNPVAEAMTGWTSAEASGRRCQEIFKIINESTRQGVESPVDKVLESGRIVAPANHTLLVRRDGTELPIDDSGAPIRAVDGKVSGVVLVFRDFTEYKQSEKKTKDAMTLLQTVTDSSADLIFAKDHEGRLIFANRATFTAVGKSREEMLGKTDVTWVPDATQARAIMENDQRVMASRQTQTFEEIFSGPNGMIVFQSTKAPIFDDAGAVVGLAGVTRDITESKRAQAALKLAEERFRLALKNLPVSVYTNDADLRYVWIYNPQMGFTVDQILGKTDDELLPLESIRELVELKRRVLSTGRGERREISATIHGADHVFDVTIEPDTDTTGRTTGITVAALETTLLVKARQQAEAATVAKDNFLATLSHELRTPLTPVAAMLGDLEKRDDLPPSVLVDVQMMRRNVDLESRLIDDLLDLTRIVRGKLSLNPEITDAHELLHTIVSMYRSEVQEKNLRLTLDTVASRHHVLADPARLQQVLWNVLKNATKFTPAGGSIDVLTDVADGWFRVTVRDTGIGMTPELLERLFKPFEQSTAETVRRYGGLGLGMAISKALMESQGGTIGASSDGLNRGSVFVVQIPLVDAPAPDGRPPTPDGQPPAPARAPDVTRALEILLVEDHADTARVMGRLLSNLGHQVLIAGSVSGAMHHFTLRPFDLLLSDIGLPDGTGLDLIRQVKARYALPSVALTGYGMEEDVAKCIAAGFDEHLTKPVNFQKLEAIITRLAGLVPDRT